MALIKHLYRRNRALLKFANQGLQTGPPKNIITNASTLKLIGSSSQAVKLSSIEFATKDTDTSLPPAVILHGLLGNKLNWKSLANAMAAKSKRKIYTLDARNHGDSPHTNDTSYPSMVADVLLFLKNSNIENTCLIGHSMGGRTAMLTALQKPDAIDKLIVVDVAPVAYKGLVASGSTIILTAMQNAMTELKGNENLSEARRIVDGILAKTIEPIGVRQFVLTNLVEKNHQITWRVNHKLLYNDYDKLMSFPEVTGSFDGPTLFIAGEKSPYISPDFHSIIYKYFPNATIEHVADAGHWVHADKPNEFLNIVTPFLTQP